ncbi:MAG: hypothetical protein H0V92_11510 [Pseudonocardiales bacterium]|nr:hypothetical protein [Pseudonocardiales bacterium]
MPPTPWTDLPEEKLIGSETVGVVARAIGELHDRQRQVVTLRDVEGWTAAEVCDLLGLSMGNQRVLLAPGPLPGARTVGIAPQRGGIRMAVHDQLRHTLPVAGCVREDDVPAAMVDSLALAFPAETIRRGDGDSSGRSGRCQSSRPNQYGKSRTRHACTPLSQARVGVGASTQAPGYPSTGSGPAEPGEHAHRAAGGELVGVHDGEATEQRPTGPPRGRASPAPGGSAGASCPRVDRRG